jgi:hypothetical protein
MARSKDLRVMPKTVTDPLLYSHPLPIVTKFYPAGFGLELSTDSPEIATAASAIWSRYPKLSDHPVVRLRIAVSPVDAEVRPRQSLPRGQENLVSIIHGPENFAVADLARGFSFACLSRNVARDHDYLVHYFLEPLAYLLLAAKHVTILHAACVALEDKAVLLSGDSGAGKTCLSYACARRGWTFLSGDTIQFHRGANDGHVIGRPFSIRFREGARDLFPELGRYAAARRLDGKVNIEPPIDDLKLATSVQAKATHIVFLKRSQEMQKATLRLVHVEDAFRQLEQTIIFGDDQFRAEQRLALARFIEPRGVFELAYSGLDDAEQALRALVTGVAQRQ